MCLYQDLASFSLIPSISYLVILPSKYFDNLLTMYYIILLIVQELVPHIITLFFPTATSKLLSYQNRCIHHCHLPQLFHLFNSPQIKLIKWILHQYYYILIHFKNRYPQGIKSLNLRLSQIKSM